MSFQTYWQLFADLKLPTKLIVSNEKYKKKRENIFQFYG